jgi:hypothetical protein
LNTKREIHAICECLGGVAHASAKGRETDRLQRLVEVKFCKFTEFIWFIKFLGMLGIFWGVRLLGV